MILPTGRRIRLSSPSRRRASSVAASPSGTRPRVAGPPDRNGYLGFLPGLDEARTGQFFQVGGDRRSGYADSLASVAPAPPASLPMRFENLHPPRVRERTPNSIALLPIHHGLQVSHLSHRGFIRFRIRTTVPFSSNDTSSMSVLMR